MGFSPTKAGAAFVLMALLMAVDATIAGAISHRVRPKRMVSAAMLSMGLGIMATTLLGAHSSFLDLMPASALIGAGGGFTVPLSALDINTMPGEKASLATAIFSATREVAGLLGIIIIGVVLSTRQNMQLHAGATQTLAYLSGYRWALVAAAIVVVASGAIAFFGLPKVRGADHTNDTTVMARYTESQLTPVSF